MDTLRWFQDHAKSLKKDYPNNHAIQDRVKSVLLDDREITLQRIQHVVAVEAGFKNWKDLLDADDIERHLVIVMAQHPVLNNFGMGLYDGYNGKPREERLAILKRDRELLRNSVDDVKLLIQWLKLNLKPVKTIYKGWSSYGLKEFAENALGQYFSNGMFIAAAMIAGYTYEFNGSSNVYFGISKKSIRQLN